MLKNVIRNSALILFIGFFGLINAAQPWNGETYHLYSYPQHFTAMTIINSLVLNGSENILDIGSGDGFTAACLADKVPQGSVVGTDLSPSMIAFAEKTYNAQAFPNLTFRLLDATMLDYMEAFEWVTSFSTLQLIENKYAVFAGVYNSLVMNGRFIADVPKNIPYILVEAIEKTIADPTWSQYFLDFSIDWFFISEAEYINLLQLAGLTPVRLEVTTPMYKFPSTTDFVNFLGEWLPYATKVPPGKKTAFLNEVVSNYLQIIPPDANNSPIFYWDRIRFEAEKMQ